MHHVTSRKATYIRKLSLESFIIREISVRLNVGLQADWHFSVFHSQPYVACPLKHFVLIVLLMITGGDIGGRWWVPLPFFSL